MPRKSANRRREESLTRESIVAAAVELLDRHGEPGLTFRALSERLSTGAGAIYWHIANKNDLLTAACDAVIDRTISTLPDHTSPEKAIRTLALSLFDAMDAHPWISSALTLAPGQMPLIRILEPLGQQIQALKVPVKSRWSAASALLNYVLGTGGRNAANGELGRANQWDRATVLDSVSKTWLELDPEKYPFTRSIAGVMRDHDDRADFLAGIDLILSGIKRL